MAPLPFPAPVRRWRRELGQTASLLGDENEDILPRPRCEARQRRPDRRAAGGGDSRITHSDVRRDEVSGGLSRKRPTETKASSRPGLGTMSESHP